MSDVPTNGANNTQGSSQNLKQSNAAHSRDIEDIDRELEAYLEEKRSGKSVGYYHSVDEQLSHIREKFGARVNPTKESEKPKEVEVVRETLENYPASKEEKPAEVHVSEKKEVHSPNQSAPVLSHEELIRSLEEKYSRGESVNVPRQTPTPEKKSPVSTEATQITASQESHPALADLKENIEPLNQNRVDDLLRKASLLTSEEQKTLSEAFLARFKRNKERMDLYTKTQTELEEELERFIENISTTASQTKETENVEIPETQAPPVSESLSQSADASPKQEENTNVNTSDTEKETPEAVEGVSSLERRYRRYLSKLEKKPLVLVYEPENGFVRKPVDPNDSALTLTYSLDSSTNTALLTVYDARGNELGVFKTPEKELDN